MILILQLANLKRKIQEMKKLLLGVIASMFMATSAMADYTLIVPQAPGKGTSVWSEIIAKNIIIATGSEPT